MYRLSAIVQPQTNATGRYIRDTTRPRVLFFFVGRRLTGASIVRHTDAVAIWRKVQNLSPVLCVLPNRLSDELHGPTTEHSAKHVMVSDVKSGSENRSVLCVCNTDSQEWVRVPFFSEHTTLRSLYAIGRPSVCLLSVTLVHPTQAVELFCNFFSPYDSSGTLRFWCQKSLVGDAPFPLKFAFKVTHPL